MWGVYQAGAGSADVTASAVDSFIEDLLEDEVAPATVNRRTQLLAQAFRLALKRGQATAIPWIRHLPENNRGSLRQLSLLP